MLWKNFSFLSRKPTLRLHELNKYHNANLAAIQQAIQNCKRDTNDTKYAVKKEFAIASSKHWANRAKKLNHRDSSSFFPNINRLFRPKEHNRINMIKVDARDTGLFEKFNILPDNAKKIDINYKIRDDTLILNVLGTHYEKINKASVTPGSRRLDALVTEHATKLREEIDHRHSTNKTIAEFFSAK